MGLKKTYFPRYKVPKNFQPFKILKPFTITYILNQIQPYTVRRNFKRTPKNLKDMNNNTLYEIEEDDIREFIFLSDHYLLRPDYKLYPILS